MWNRLLLRFCVGLCVAGAYVPETAFAEVEGQTYAVTVQTNFTATFTDELTFVAGGSLTASSGASGTWTETTLGPVSQWSGRLSTISLSGVAIGPLLIGTGGDTSGHAYLLYGRKVRHTP